MFSCLSMHTLTNTKSIHLSFENQSSKQYKDSVGSLRIRNANLKAVIPIQFYHFNPKNISLRRRLKWLQDESESSERFGLDEVEIVDTDNAFPTPCTLLMVPLCLMLMIMTDRNTGKRRAEEGK